MANMIKTEVIFSSKKELKRVIDVISQGKERTDPTDECFTFSWLIHKPQSREQVPDEKYINTIGYDLESGCIWFHEYDWERDYWGAGEAENCEIEDNVLRFETRNDLAYLALKELSKYSNEPIKVRYASDNYGCMIGVNIYDNGECTYIEDEEDLWAEIGRMMWHDNINEM